MKIWDVKVLLLGKMTMPVSTMLSVCYAFGTPKISDNFTINVPYLGFLLRCEGHNIVVDTGISEKFIVDGKAWGGIPAEGGRSFMAKALAKENVTAAEVETVIYTHLHNDHAGNCHLFSQAEHVFQEDEWRNLLEPLPIQKVKRDYDLEVIPELKALNCSKVDGDVELTDGIRLYKTPGHTLGSQSVAVNTRKGVVVIVGDLLTAYIQAFPQTTELIDLEGNRHRVPPAPAVLGDAIPSSVTYNFYDFYDSVKKVRAIVSRNEPGFIIPGHETSLVPIGI